MAIKIITTFTLFATISCGTVFADSDNIAYANYKTGKNNLKPALIAPIMDVVLDENLYVIQPQTSKMTFRVDSPMGEVWGNFQDFEGSFIMVESRAHAEPVSIDINTESLGSDNGVIGVMLKSESFFDVENFPSMHFVGSNFEWFNDTHAVLKGFMTIKNVTREVAFYVELIDADVENRYSNRITVKASTTIRRSEFGIYTLLPAISDDVNLVMSIDAVKNNTAIAMLD